MTVSLSDDFLDQVKDALENLYDFPALQRHPLAAPHTTNSSEPVGYALRRELIDAIESLNPGKSVSARSGPARVYNLVHMHYVGAMTLQETANDLGVSLRQAYRDLKQGQESIAEVLHFNRQQTATTEPAAEPSLSQLSSIDAEVTRLNYNAELISAASVLQSACKAVDVLATRHERQLDLTIAPLDLAVESVAARQIFINLLSLSIRDADAPPINVHLHSHNHLPQLTITYQAARKPPTINQAIQQLIDQLGWTVETEQSEQQQSIQLHLSQRNRTILIIDDNDGLVDLMRRYLEETACHVLTAGRGEDGLRLAKEHQPHAIIMDLMMPGMDGWEVLQHLRTSEDTQNIPVMICSVINDPDLAFSLGASQFIEKPVNKEKIHQALSQLNR